MSILQPGDTCWRSERAGRAAFLVDYQDYYAAAFAAIKAAKRSILLLGWGFDPRTRLLPDGHEAKGDPDEIGHVLIGLARERPELDVRVLIWKSAFAVSATQEFFPHRARPWFEGTQVKFRLDDSVPFGACHHQKTLVIDDALAFCAGGDFCGDRWDSAAHLDKDARRLMPDQEGHQHPPRHDVTLMVDGPAARALGDLARERWRHAVGETVKPPPPVESDPWPDHVKPALRDVEIGIARTEAAWRRPQSVEEIRRLGVASIAAARKTIYLENQYFTSPVAAEALAARLAEPDGPEVVLISTQHSPSWFDQMTMDRTRSHMLRRLRRADVYGRFRAYCPVTLKNKPIIVHSKAGVFDDTLARVGSANLNNRSGGFDSELEASVVAVTDADREAVSAFRNRLVGHFLSRSPDAVAEAIERTGGLIGAIDALNDHGRLQPIEPLALGPAAAFIAAYHLGDPLGVADSFKPFRRRRQLERLVHAVAADPRSHPRWEALGEG